MGLDKGNNTYLHNKTEKMKWGIICEGLCIPYRALTSKAHTSCLKKETQRSDGVWYVQGSITIQI